MRAVLGGFTDFRPVQRQQVRLTYADCDPAQLVYYAAWLPKMEQMLLEWFYRHGYRFDTMFEVVGAAPVTRSVHCEYTAPARLYDLIDMVMGIQHVGESSYVVGFRMTRQCDETVVARAQLVCVCIGDGGPVPIPAALRQLMESSEGR